MPSDIITSGVIIVMRLLIRVARYFVELAVGAVAVAIALTTARQTWYQLHIGQIYAVFAFAIVLAFGGFYVHRWLTRLLR